MKTEIIPEDISAFIKMSVDKKKRELEKAKEKEKELNEERAMAEKARRADREKTIELAKKNLLLLNEFIKEEPLKSYLDLKEKTGFPLWESNFEGDTNPDATIFLRNDGVYRWIDNQKSYRNAKKITLSSIADDALNNPGLFNASSYIRSLVKWNASEFVEYLRKQFTPLR